MRVQKHEVAFKDINHLKILHGFGKPPTGDAVMDDHR